MAEFWNPTGVGIVQSPQYFSTTTDMDWLERAAGANRGDVLPAHPALAGCGRSGHLCGTCAVYRRSALDQSGGFLQIGPSEDVYTGVAMGRAGYEVQYVPVLVSRGVCPDGINTFITPQYRWCEAR